MTTDNRFLRRCSTREFRAGMLDIFPALKESRSLRALTAYLLRATPLEDGSVLVPREVLKLCVGTKGNNRFNGGNLLAEFSERVAYLEPVELVNEATGELVDYSFTKGQARAVRVLWPADAMDLITVERDRPIKDRLQVHFVDGTPYSRASRAETRKEQVTAASENVKCVEAGELQAYLNGKASNGFAKMLDHLDELEGEARATLTGETLRTTLDTLMTIAEQPQPIYKAVEGSTRLYESARGFTFLHRPLRWLMNEQLDWVEYDLVAAQAAIVCQLWGAQLMSELFAHGDNLWKVLLAELDIGVEMKDFLKKLNYGVTFGAGYDRLVEVAREFAQAEAGNDKELAEELLRATFLPVVEAFWSLPIIVDLIEARTRRLHEIQRAMKNREPIISAVGERLTGTPTQILAQEAQAIEFRLVWPGLKVAIESDVLMLYQADGWSAKLPADKTKAERIEKRMIDAVAQVAADMGIHTRLERKAA